MSEKVRIELPVLLPDIPDERDGCVERLTGSLSGRSGIEEVHVVRSENGESGHLCIHYDTERTSLPQIRQTARSIGAELTDRFGHFVRPVRGIGRPGRARTIARRIRSWEGVIEASVAAGGSVRIEYAPVEIEEGELVRRLEELGLRFREQRDGGAERSVREAPDRTEGGEGLDETEDTGERGGDHGAGLLGEHSELVFAILAGACVGAGVLLSWVGAGPFWLSDLLYGGAYVFGGYYTAKEAISAVRVGRFEVDFLMLVAAIGAAALGRWLEGGFLLFLFSLGHALEHYAMDRARRAIEELADLAPDVAVLVRGGEEREVSVDELEAGDEVLVRPNERISADGIVIEGSSAVNEAPVTGESMPVDKSAFAEAARSPDESEEVPEEHRVFAGTINGSGLLRIRVTRPANQTTLAKVVQMIAEAETERAPSERFTDRFERYFVPAVLALVILLLFAWVPLEEPFVESFYRAMAVLVAASPCALAIATPSAVLSGIARAGWAGVLVKGGGPLERLGRLTTLAFDKTGTVTEGKPEVTHVLPHADTTEAELLRTAVSVERLSDHPLARAITVYGEDRVGGESVPPAAALETLTGRGIRADLEGEPVYIGSPELFEEIGGPPPPEALTSRVADREEEGHTVVLVRRGDSYLGGIALKDTPRPEARTTIDRLREIGIRRMVMISGDHQRVTEAVAREVGLDEARGSLLPDEKVEVLRKMRDEGEVAMIGDGVNDAPAMAHASVGVAMGAAGSDVALETSDVALMADRLGRLPFAIGLSRQTRRIIVQNLWISLGMVAVLIPATIAGLTIGPVVVLHEGSTLLVVFNALRLLRYGEREEMEGSTRAEVPDFAPAA